MFKKSKAKRNVYLDGSIIDSSFVLAGVHCPSSPERRGRCFEFCLPTVLVGEEKDERRSLRRGGSPGYLLFALLVGAVAAAVCFT